MADPSSPGPEATVSLREVTAENLRSILRLKVAPAQEGFVASNAVSIAQAHFEPKAWFRAVYADDVPVGFAMLSIDADKPEYDLWRFMIGEPHQLRGFGRRALELLVEHVRGLPRAEELRLSHGRGEGNPAPFYEALGFEHTGEEEEGELVMSLRLDASLGSR